MSKNMETEKMMCFKRSYIIITAGGGILWKIHRATVKRIRISQTFSKFESANTASRVSSRPSR